jgi:hypothetical protein
VIILENSNEWNLSPTKRMILKKKGEEKEKREEKRGARIEEKKR